jgi:multiple sugar transport system permease protein
VLLRTLFFALIVLLLKLVLAVPLAMLIRLESVRNAAWLLLLPWMLPVAVSSLGWLWLFYDVDGGANLALTWFGYPQVAWFGGRWTAAGLLILFNVWRELPLWALAVSRAMKGFGGDLEFLATTDGLSRWQHWRLMVMPRLSPVIAALAIISTIWAFGEFESVWLLTRGGPGTSTEILTVYAFRDAFQNQNLAAGAAAFLYFIPLASLSIFGLMTLYCSAAKRAHL